LWSKNCAAVASGNARTAGGAGPRCAKCNEFWRVTVKPKILNFLSPAHKHTTDKDLSTGQKPLPSAASRHVQVRRILTRRCREILCGVPGRLPSSCPRRPDFQHERPS
ncbi:unnamed protein product, partial [Pylaiella littoralis]